MTKLSDWHQPVVLLRTHFGVRLRLYRDAAMRYCLMRFTARSNCNLCDLLLGGSRHSLIAIIAVLTGIEVYIVVTLETLLEAEVKKRISGNVIPMH